ncbi:hypothetical protein [Microbacterium sp. No. 7]|uniref:hypothetical protein n=1 Tax=Microbacterium sp. No. 7 TaxID=1714373 RepID=UPI0006D1AE67|nr:hypothetical protein [Microbacterium sp. No. 7]ALJ19585.1 hypothetical protein AOA12_06545 [Microbacterium sp. No. 7]
MARQSRQTFGSSQVTFFDVEALRGGIVAWGDRVADQVFDEAEEIVKDAAVEAVARVHAADTKTGRERAAKGKGLPGRHETGLMAEQIREYEITRSKREFVGRWGWLRVKRDYFDCQEHGTRHLAGMGALWGSYVHAQDRLWAALSRGRRR